MKDYTKLLKRLDEAHLDQQEWNKETFGARDFDPEEPTLHSEAAEAIRKLTAPKPAMEVTHEMVDTVLEYNRTPRRHLFEYPYRADESRKLIGDAEALVRTILKEGSSE